MNNLKKTSSLLSAILFGAILTLTACGGGGSDSGGPPAPTIPLFPVGFYNGTITISFDGPGLEPAPSTPSAFSVEVAGQTAGTQQVRIAFAQFSGTSAISPDGQFSIPSGIFPVPVRTQTGVLFATCQGELLFEGTFVDQAVTGSVSTSTPFECDDSRLGPLTSSATFEATFGAAKTALPALDFSFTRVEQ